MGNCEYIYLLFIVFYLSNNVDKEFTEADIVQRLFFI